MKTSIVLLFVVAAIFLELATNIAAQQCISYLSPSAAVAKGKAPGLTWKLLSDNNGVKEYALVFAKGDEVLSGLEPAAVEHRHVGAGRANHHVGACDDLLR